MRLPLGAIVAGIRKRFYDNFSIRSNTTGNLGIATDGSLWDSVNGTIQVTTGAATATTTPTSGGAGNTYPIATVNLPKSDNIIKLSNTSEGSAVALWVQSSSDWWMVNVEGTQVTNTNYAGSTYWSYNYAYQYTQANPSNYVYTFTAFPIQIPSYSYQTTSGITNYSPGATTFYAVFASGTPYSAATPYSSFRDYWSSTPYSASGSTPYTVATSYASSAYSSWSSSTAYTAGTAPTTYTKGPTSYYKLSNTYYISSAAYSSGGGGTTYTAGATTWTKSTNYGAPYTASTNYTAGTTVYGAPYSAGITSWTASSTIFYTTLATTYTAGAATYTLIPPGYSSAIPYTSSTPYTSAWISGAPYSPGTSYDWSFTPGTYYFVTTSGFTFNTSATYYTYASGTTTTYSEYLKIKKSVANVVSEITSALVSNTQTAKSLLVSILGNQITARAYSDTNFVTQIGSDLVYSATGATITTTYGIGVSPSAYNQSAIIGSSVEINRN